MPTMHSATTASRLDKFKTFLQYPLPHHALSRVVHRLTRIQRPAFLKTLAIYLFIKIFKVDMSEAECGRARGYVTFNAFFTRSLRQGVRPVAPGDAVITSPVDGTVSQRGAIQKGHIIQAKGRIYSVLELLGGDTQRAQAFENGRFVTIYLAPRDYHRIHMPLTGNLREMVHIPGRLFSVNPATTRAVPRLFARNERIASIFDTAAGFMAVVKVGALFVSSIETVWAGEVTPPAGKRIRVWRHGKTGAQGEVELEKGAEMARFNMGSTVILLFPARRMGWDAALRPDTTVRMGQSIGRLIAQN